MAVQISVSQRVNAPIGAVFDAAVSIDARELIQKNGPLPGIVDVAGHDAPWSAIGEVRRHSLSDRSSVREELTAFVRDQNFGYRLTEFTGAFAPLVEQARADWHFTRVSPEIARIDWTYHFTPKTPLAEPFLWFIVKLFWPGYLKAALGRVKQKAEASLS